MTDGKVTTYPAPAGEEPSGDFSVSVDGREVFVYRARVSAMPFARVWPGSQRPLDQTEIASFAYWDMSGPVTVEVTSERPIERLAVHPAHYQATPNVEGNRITFEMSRPGQITIEVNGSHKALHLFANPPADGQDKPAAEPGVLYFPPGEHHPGKIRLQSGQTVCIAGGAVVHAAIEATDAADLRIVGRGILDVSTFERFDAWGGISLHGCRNVRISGIIIRDPNVYGIVPVCCRDVAISNVKLIGLWRYNSDGIDPSNCQQVTIEDCFVRSFDDSIVLKGVTNWWDYRTDQGPLRDIAVRRCVIWNDWGRALEIGAETVAPEYDNILFEDCDIIHCAQIVMDIQNGDRAVVRNVTYRDIRVELDDETPRPQLQQDDADRFTVDPNERYCPRLIVLEVTKTNYSNDIERGRIEGIRFHNISVTGPRSPRSVVRGYDEDHPVEDVTVENLCLNGKRIRDAKEAGFTVKEYVRGFQLL